MIQRQNKGEEYSGDSIYVAAWIGINPANSHDVESFMRLDWRCENFSLPRSIDTTNGAVDECSKANTKFHIAFDYTLTVESPFLGGQ